MRLLKLSLENWRGVQQRSLEFADGVTLNMMPVSAVPRMLEHVGIGAAKSGRTVADLADSDAITAEHLSEAINYRTLDRNYWQY